MKKLLLSLAGLLLAATPAFAKDYSLTMNNQTDYSDYPNNYTSSYTTKTTDGTYKLENFNNATKSGTTINRFSCPRAGRSGAASVATIATEFQIPAKVTTVKVGIETLSSNNASKVKITLEKSTDKSTWSQIGTFTSAQGDQTVTISGADQVENAYYRVKFDCQKVSNGFVRVNALNITASDEGSTGKQPCGLSLTPADVAYTVNLGETFTAPALSNPNNLAVTWTSSKPEVASVDASTGAVTLGTVADTTRITATTEGDETHDGGSVYYDLTVVDPNAPGTVNNPYTVAQALEACASKPTGVYVKGVVVSASEWSTKYNNVDYYIADDASADASAQLNVFRGIWDSEVTNAPSDKTPEVGATVIVYGDLSVYNNTKNQVNAGNKIVSYTAPAPVIKPLGEVTYTFGEAVDQVAASATIDVKVGDKVTFKAENASKMIVSNINSGAELATADAAEVNYTIVDGVTGLSVKAIGVNSEGNEDSKIATVTLNIIKPQLGELVVKYGDKTVPADGTVSTVSVEEGTSFTLSAENATLITVEYGEDVNETFTTLPAVWKPSKHAEEIVTITANLGTDTKELKFFLTVTERQAIETENEEMVYEITPESISGLGGSYALHKDIIDENAGLSFAVKAMKGKDAIQINYTTSEAKSAYKSGIVSTGNTMGREIEKVVLTTVSTTMDKIKVMMGNTANGYTEASGSVKASIDYVEDNTEIYGVVDGNTNVYIYTPDNDYKYFAIISNGNAAYISNVQVYYKGCPKVNVTMDNADVLDGATFSKETSAAMNFNVKSKGDVKVYYRINKKPATDTPAENGLARAGEANPFTLHQGEDITIDGTHDSVEYYAQKGLYKTPVRTINFDVATGVEAIGAEAGEAVYFDLQGNRVAAPETGVYIKVVGGRASKVLF